MPLMSRLVLPALAVVALGGAACAGTDRPLPAACTRGTQTIVNALRAAPGPVALDDGTRLSTCIARARTDAEIQTIGSLYTGVADNLATRLRVSDTAALRLGYLIGAARRGARHTSGIHEELVRRLEQTVGVDGPPPSRRRPFKRGLAAGARNG